MKILIPSPLIYPHYTGGMEIFNYHFVRETLRRGHRVHLITREALPGIEAVKIHRLLSRNWRLDCLQITYRLLRMNGSAAVHVPYASNSRLVYSINLCRKLGRPVPYMVYIHGGGMHPWADASSQQSFFRGASHVAAVSRTLKDAYEKRMERNVEYLPPIIPFQMPQPDKIALRSRLGFSASDFVFVMVGSVKKIKGSDFLVDTVLSMDRRFVEQHGLRFVFLGDGPLRAELSRRVSAARLEEHIVFKGLVSHEEVGVWLKAADAYLIPSLFEGTPVALLEALFHGLPAIGTDTEGIADIIEDGRTGLLFQPSDRACLIRQIETLIRSPERSTSLGRAGRRLFESDYSFARVMDRHLAILQETAVAG